MRNFLFLLVLAGGLPDQQAVEPLVGTLEIEAAALPDDVSGTLEAGWLFINGELRGKLPLSRQMKLAPGVYEVRVVIAGWRNQQPIYWTVRWPRVVVSQGATTNLRTARAVNEALQHPPAAGTSVLNRPLGSGVEYSISAERQPFSHVTADASTLERFGKQAADEQMRKWESYRSGSDFAKVLSVAQQLEAKPPSRPLVWIDVDESHGGPREFDVEQLRFLRKALEPDIDGWIGRIVRYESDLTTNQRDWISERIRLLQAQNQAFRRNVDDVFEFIMTKLGQAARRDP